MPIRARIPFVQILALSFLLAPPLMGERPAPGAPGTPESRKMAWDRHLELDEASEFKGLEWRNIGPVVQGGRVVDIESVPGEPYSFYVAYASGGLWKTTNNGVTFEPLFDHQPTMIMGDVAIDPQNPNTIWVGTGESNSSRSSYGGLGIFRSDDGGATWRPMGLEATDRIGRVLVDPRDSKRIYVAALGKLYTPGGQRGIYRSTDGGDSWQEVLAGDAEGFVGFIDLAFEPGNPDVLYAASWERSRRPWQFVEGGEGSGLWKSSDGGDTWQRLEGGFPRSESIGRIGLAVSPSHPNIVYASVDNQESLPEELWDMGDSPLSAKRLQGMSKEDFLAHDSDTIEDFIRSNDLDTELDAKKLITKLEDGELTIQDLIDELSDANANLFDTDIRGLEIYRSDDGGASWKRTHDEPLREVVYTYGYYFGQIRVAPDDPDRLFALGVPLITSDDGGKTWRGANGRGVHVDHQAQWIDPHHPERTWLGNDGGLDASYDGGKTWVKIDAEPVGQFYAIALDMAEPYNVYGGLQDNGSLRGSSRSRPGIDPWVRIGGGDGMHVEIDPRDDTVYTGYQFGFYFRSGGGPPASVRPRDKLKEVALRYNWQTPIRLSSHNPDVLYFGSQKLYRSLDRGDTWTAISDDLTQASERGDVPYATITTLSESPLRFGLIWVGTDDGRVWVTDDHGVDWFEVDGALPATRWVSRVVASQHVEERAYLSLNGYRDDDATPYLYVTEDLGKSWRSLAKGLPSEAINVVREDPVNADVLYVGSDRGVYVSLDRGESWQGLPNGLPNVPVHDLKVHPRDRELVAGTHGRSIFVLDALPIQELGAVRDETIHVFPVEPVQYQRAWQGRVSRWFEDLIEFPEVRIPFWASEAGKVTLAVLDEDDRELRTIETEVEPGVSTLAWDLLLDRDLALEAERSRNAEAEAEDGKDEKKGRHHRRRGGEETADMGAEKGSRAKIPWAEADRLGWSLYPTPGRYTLQLRLGEATSRTDFEIEKPEPQTPRSEPPPKIRGQKDEDDD